MEIYTKINGYDNYAISNFGNVLNITTQKFLKPLIHNKGYYYVCLWKNSVRKNYTIHRLLGIYFIDNPNNLPCIDHIDGNRTNNSISNLRWASYQTNNRNSTKRYNCSSIHKGVVFNKNKWNAQIHNYKKIHIGRYDTEIEAASAYNDYIINNNLEDFILNDV